MNDNYLSVIQVCENIAKYEVNKTTFPTYGGFMYKNCDERSGCGRESVDIQSYFSVFLKMAFRCSRHQPAYQSRTL